MHPRNGHFCTLSVLGAIMYPKSRYFVFFEGKIVTEIRHYKGPAPTPKSGKYRKSSPFESGGISGVRAGQKLVHFTPPFCTPQNPPKSANFEACFTCPVNTP